MTSYEQYEKDCKRIRKENGNLLKDFKKWLSDKKLSEKTIYKHVSNVDFYIDDFLLYEDAMEAADGVSYIGMFLGYWFIRKAMWASKAAIKENAASLKKFYEFMLERKKISKESFEHLKERIKEDMPEWTATMERYDDPAIEDPEEIWGL
ncbi:MAG: recombinase [Methanobacteriota archaeon]